MPQGRRIPNQDLILRAVSPQEFSPVLRQSGNHGCSFLGALESQDPPAVGLNRKSKGKQKVELFPSFVFGDFRIPAVKALEVPHDVRGFVEDVVLPVCALVVIQVRHQDIFSPRRKDHHAKTIDLFLRKLRGANVVADVVVFGVAGFEDFSDVHHRRSVAVTIAPYDPVEFVDLSFEGRKLRRPLPDSACGSLEVSLDGFLGIEQR
eukprot:CAMPEP_0201250472 /NCGR_PEP_ID=MMETSP0852-20130820/63708_1 /ASSEMBLY_ACC=CAM_ASM_000632 /TAXON_ID=183588 /ORGANISM="Pseudo-nitzschia fraudulenta, Strain WWA7" /LENGTH=205 /DNA_ID=CAMNT_0047549831 /DNA_START=281 /DNA_END=899 /DNA_ORIENTATION=+